MEERVAGSSSSGRGDKKYVLYTVVGDDRSRTTPVSWVMRIVLGSLLIVALAVVPYVSLRLAQASSRTLVVFQPVPMRNKSFVHHLPSSAADQHKTENSKSLKPVQLMQVADLKLEKNGTNEGEISFVNDTASFPTTSEASKSNLTVTESESDKALLGNSTSELGNSTHVDVSANITLQGKHSDDSSNEKLKNESISVSFEVDAVKLSDGKDSNLLPPTSPTIHDQSETAAPSLPQVFVTTNAPLKSVYKPDAQTHQITKQETMSDEPRDDKPNSVQDPTFNVNTDSQKTLSHKLVYVATSASGSHVGGICVWKVDKNVTDWSFFYDNIPVEFQSGHDSGDHELRGTLAAVRTWASNWQDAHVILRSQHNAIEHSDLTVRKSLIKDLEKISAGHFTYELEWRLPEADTLVKIASSLARLHQDYKFWFHDFSSSVDELLGKQDWMKMLSEKRVKVDEESFYSEDSLKTSTGNDSAVSASDETTPTAFPQTKTQRSLQHKLVYVATSASGNHVGGFCVWKVDKNITDWSYFYDNIPVEYQSNHDSADHEQRATLAAVRAWAHLWQDAHVTLRSQHIALERADNPVKKILVDTLDRLSEGHFTYDLEWRLRKSDDLVKISYSLSRLHRNFAHWFAVFKASVDNTLGVQDWSAAANGKRVILTDEHFYTNETRPQVDQASVKSTLAELER